MAKSGFSTLSQRATKTEFSSLLRLGRNELLSAVRKNTHKH